MIFVQGSSESSFWTGQIGLSTLLGVICADQLCWNTGSRFPWWSHTQEDARQKLKNIYNVGLLTPLLY